MAQCSAVGSVVDNMLPKPRSDHWTVVVEQQVQPVLEVQLLAAPVVDTAEWGVDIAGVDRVAQQLAASPVKDIEEVQQ